MILFFGLLLSTHLWADQLKDAQTLMLKKQWDEAYSKSVDYALKAKTNSQMEAVTRLVAQIPKENQSRFQFVKAFGQIEVGTLVRPEQLGQSKNKIVLYIRGQLQKNIEIKDLSLKGVMYPTALLQWRDCERKEHQLICESQLSDTGLLGPGLYSIEIQTANEKMVDYFFMPESFVYLDMFHITEPSGFEKLTSKKIAYSILGFQKEQAKNFVSFTLSLYRPGPSFELPVKELVMTGFNFQPKGVFEAPSEGAFDFVFSWHRQKDLGPLQLSMKSILSRFILIATPQK